MSIKAEAITHVAIAVLDLERAIKDYCDLFEFEEVERLEVGSEGVKVAMLKLANSEIELLSPISENSSVARFIRERGEGMHHIAIRVPNVGEAITKAKALGLRVLDEKPRTGARGTEAAFVHPKSLHGVLLEFYSR